MQTTNLFPLQGVIGVVANSFDELNTAASFGLQCVEIRADLLLDTGLSVPEVISTIEKAAELNLATLFTLRHPTHGGKFGGSETERVKINQLALTAGADIIDLEWDTEAAKQMPGNNRSMILSYHNFNDMPDQTELLKLTKEMQSTNPRAIKVVPTAHSLTDAVEMLEWVGKCDDKLKRIGFAMGPTGACSRILTIAHGAPITYASFGDAVAPGQVEITQLLKSYTAMALNKTTSVTAVTGEKTEAYNQAIKLNQHYRKNNSNQVAIGFPLDQKEELEQHKNILRISEIQEI